MKRWFYCLAVLLVLPGYGHAQTVVVNPTTLIFNASPTHAQTDPLDGTALLTRYEARYFLATQCNPTCPATGAAFTLNLNKPAPVSGVITVTNVFQGLVLNQQYKAVVVAIGPGGTSPYSNVSDPFGNRGTQPAPASPSNLKVASE